MHVNWVAPSIVAVWQAIYMTHGDLLCFVSGNDHICTHRYTHVLPQRRHTCCYRTLEIKNPSLTCVLTGLPYHCFGVVYPRRLEVGIWPSSNPKSKKEGQPANFIQHPCSKCLESTASHEASEATLSYQYHPTTL